MEKYFVFNMHVVKMLIALDRIQYCFFFLSLPMPVSSTLEVVDVLSSKTF
jgi:hypothetical protein